MLALLAAGLVAASTSASADSLSATVTVSVNLLSTSGVCEAAPGAPGVEVACTVPKGPLLPLPGEVALRRVGTIPAGYVVEEPLPLYSDGTKITSWRVVTLDNARYVELTIAW